MRYVCKHIAYLTGVISIFSIQDTLQSGLFKIWTWKYLPTMSQDHQVVTSNSVALQDVWLVFVMVAVGLLAAGFSLMLEVSFEKYSSRSVQMDKY